MSNPLVYIRIIMNNHFSNLKSELTDMLKAPGLNGLWMAVAAAASVNAGNNNQHFLSAGLILAATFFSLRAFPRKSEATTSAAETTREISLKLNSQMVHDQISSIQQARDEAVRDIVAISAEIVARARETERKFEAAPLPTVTVHEPDGAATVFPIFDHSREYENNGRGPLPTTIETIDGIPTIKPVSKFKKTRTPKAPK